MEEDKRFSICIECAQHQELKSYIAANSTPDCWCTLCLQTEHLCCSSAQTPDLVNVLKGLIRIHFNEMDYNRHWGGEDSPTALLSVQNEIINVSRIVSKPPNQELGLELLDNELSSLPYPDVDKGIGLYAGYTDGEQNMLLQAIKDWDAWPLINLKRNLQKTNAHELEMSFKAKLAGIIDPCKEKIPIGTSFFRARIGFDRIEDDNSLEPNPIRRYLPFTNADLGAPPPPIASAGRLNRQGVSYLYVGSSPETAISEIRPHPGHLVSLGQFKTVRDLMVLDFSKPTFLDFPLSDVGLEKFELTSSIDRDLSRPITPERRAAYISAQFIADLIRQCGFDGVLYRSSVSEGTNLCVFDPRTFVFVPELASLFRTKSVQYKYEKLAPSGERQN